MIVRPLLACWVRGLLSHRFSLVFWLACLLTDPILSDEVQRATYPAFAKPAPLQRVHLVAFAHAVPIFPSLVEDSNQHLSSFRRNAKDARGREDVQEGRVRARPWHYDGNYRSE